jgi:transcriptional regulator with XRE-family HTH domain
MRTKTRTTGLDLKLLRISRGLEVRQIAAAAGCSHTYINRIEGAARPSERACTKYLAAAAKALQ